MRCGWGWNGRPVGQVMVSGGDEDELAGTGVGTTEDAVAGEGGVAVGGKLEVEVEVLHGVGEGLEALVAANEAEGGDALGGDVEFDAGPALSGGFEGSGELVDALALEFEGGVGDGSERELTDGDSAAVFVGGVGGLGAGGGGSGGRDLESLVVSSPMSFWTAAASEPRSPLEARWSWWRASGRWFWASRIMPRW